MMTKHRFDILRMVVGNIQMLHCKRLPPSARRGWRWIV